MTKRLTSTAHLPPGVLRPAYRPDDHACGIVHLGLGAFHKSHQAVYTDDALAASGGDWRITGVSLRSPVASIELGPQNCLYTCISRGLPSPQARVIGSIGQALHLGSDRAGVEAALVSPNTRIVTITVTEKGYGIDRANGGVDPNHAAIAADLAEPNSPTGVAGLIVKALKRRRDAGDRPFTVLSCDNLPENGQMLRGLIVDFATRLDPELGQYIRQNVTFPSSMVDRITPAATDATRSLANRLTGFHDAAAIECEAFSQWVIEDEFPTGRPAWDAGGAQLVKDVRPFETMKLRMLNGAHSMLAYAGFLAGHTYVRDVMNDPELRALIVRHLAAAASTVGGISQDNRADYADALLLRFANPEIAHETYQISMDGSQKMPQRIFTPALDAIRRGTPTETFAFATAAWMRYTLGRTDSGDRYDIRDPREAELQASLQRPSAQDLFEHISGVQGLVPVALSSDANWRRDVISALDEMLRRGMRGAIQLSIRASS